jgi:tetratricopeptide (TPR) repeat protein
LLAAANCVGVFASSLQDKDAEDGRQAYELGDYPKAEKILREAAIRDPQNAQLHWLLAKTYYQSQHLDAAISSAEKAVELEPHNSVYHEWLGRSYGEKANRAAWLSAMSLAKKAQKEFQKAVRLDERNFSARQALIEFDCSAPGIVGGGEDKAGPEIAALAAMDPAEGHYAQGNCRRQKNDYAVADVEFTKAIASHPKSADLLYDMGDYFMKRSQPEELISIANEGEKVAPTDVRGKFYRAVAFILKKESLDNAEHLFQEYLEQAPLRDNFPHPREAHEWLAKLYESENKTDAAIREYEVVLRLNPKSKTAHDGLKRLRKAS